MAALPVLFTPQERTRAPAIWGTANSLSFPVGPILGGWLLTSFWWGSVFLINVPVVVLAIGAVLWPLLESRAPHPVRLDLPGVLVSASGWGGGLRGDPVHRVRWADAHVIAPLASGRWCSPPSAGGRRAARAGRASR